MHSVLFPILCFIVIRHSALASPINQKKNPKPSDVKTAAPVESKISDSTDDRINLNFNHGHAFAQGPLGFSGSDANTYGVNAGIIGPGGSYDPLFSQAGGQGSSYSTGLGAPNTWAGGNTHLGNGYAGGDMGAGFYGGDGFANADSLSQQMAIPIDPYGTVLLHNLKTKKPKVAGTSTRSKPIRH